MKLQKITMVIGAFILSAVGYAAITAQTSPKLVVKQEANRATYTKDGELVLPADWRTWVFAGTSITPNEMNDGKALFPEFHNIYTSPETYEAAKRTGKLPEGAMVAKELSKVASKHASSGNGYFAGDLFALAIMVKDSERYSDTEGWGFYTYMRDEKTGYYAKTAKLAAKESCYECHADGAETELVFSQYYPVLKEAMDEGRRKSR